MARARKSQKGDEEETKSHRGLPPPYSSKPGGNRYVVYVDYNRDTPRVLVWSFNELYAARWFINSIIGPTGEYDKIDDLGGRKCIRSRDLGVRIGMYGEDLEKILCYEMTHEEAEWKDPERLRAILGLKYGQWGQSHRETEEERTEDAEPASTPKPKTEKASPRVKKDNTDTSGFVSANDLAKTLKVESSVIRGVLRSLKFTKPSHGWSWPKEEADKIRDQVRKQLK